MSKRALATCSTPGRSTSRRSSRPTRWGASAASTSCGGPSTRPQALDSDCVSLWSGVDRASIGRDQALVHLASGLRRVLDYAERREVTIGLEPEPGMVVDTMATLDELLQRVESPRLRLTLDVGHLHCLGETPIAAVIRQWGDLLVNVHIEDMRHGVHEHLMFGEGEIDFPPVIEALREIDYDGGVHVELSRHSHDAPRAAATAMAFLSPLMQRGARERRE